MKEDEIAKKLFRFIRKAFIIIIINMIIAYLFFRLTNFQTNEDYGKIMIIYGALFMLLGTGGSLASTKSGANMRSVYYSASSNRNIGEDAYGKMSGNNKNFKYILNLAFTGAVTIAIGLVFYSA